MELNNPRKMMIKLTIPLFFEFLLYILVNNVDQFMLSFLSKEAVSAVTNTGQLSWVMTLFFQVASTASVVLISQYKGAGDNETEKTVYPLALIVNLILGVIISVVCIFLIDPILNLLNIAPGLTYDYAKVYMQIVGGMFIFQAIENCFAAYLKSNALVKEALVISIIVNLLNVGGNALALFVFNHGVAGVAWSSGISRTIGMILSVIVFVRKVGFLDLKALKNPNILRLLYKIFRIGGPSIGENFSYDLSQLVLMSFINPMGDSVVNAKSYVCLIIEFAYLASMASAEALQIVEGRLIGADRKDEASKEVFRTLRICLIIVECITVLLWLCSDLVVGIFPSADEEVLRVAKILFTVEIFLEIGRVTNIIMVRALQSAGDVLFPVFMSIIFTWFVSVGAGYILAVPLGFGIKGIWIAMATDEIVRGTILALRFGRGQWKKINLIDKGQNVPQS